MAVTEEGKTMEEEYECAVPWKSSVEMVFWPSECRICSSRLFNLLSSLHHSRLLSASAFLIQEESARMD